MCEERSKGLNDTSAEKVPSAQRGGPESRHFAEMVMPEFGCQQREKRYGKQHAGKRQTTPQRQQGAQFCMAAAVGVVRGIMGGGALIPALIGGVDAAVVGFGFGSDSVAGQLKRHD